MYAGIRVIPCLSVSGRPAWKEKETLYHLDYTDKLLHCCYLNARQPPHQISEKPFYVAARPDSLSSALQPYPWQGTHPTFV